MLGCSVDCTSPMDNPLRGRTVLSVTRKYHDTFVVAYRTVENLEGSILIVADDEMDAYKKFIGRVAVWDNATRYKYNGSK